MPINHLSQTDPTTVRRVYALGRALSSIFSSCGLHYWSSSGTTLGIVRHRGLIPWDDDLDLCIMEEEEAMLAKMGEEELPSKGLRLEKVHSYAWRIYHEIGSEPVQNSSYNHRYPFCDVF